VKIHWLDEPEEHDYPAAESYLTLLYSEEEARATVAELRVADVVSFKAKDIFRASRLPLLGVSNSHVDKNLEKIKDGRALSPILLARSQGGLIIADGYHRMCAVYLHNEDAEIPAKIV